MLKSTVQEGAAVHCFKRPRYIAQPDEPVEKRPRVEPSVSTEETGKFLE